MSTSKLQKINKQHERTRTMLHKRLINMPCQYEDIFEDVKEFVRQKARSMSTNTGYLVPALLATSFVASLTSKIMTTTHSVTANVYTIIVRPPTVGKTQSITIAAQDPMQQLQEAMDLPDFLIKKISSSSGITKILNNNKKRSRTQLDSRKQVIAFQDRVITINIKEAQHPLKREKQMKLRVDI